MKSKIFLSFLIVAGTMQCAGIEGSYASKIAYDKDKSEMNYFHEDEYDYDKDIINIFRSIGAHDMIELKQLIKPGNEKVFFQVLASDMDFNQYCDMGYNFLHYFISLLSLCDMEIIESNFNAIEIIQYKLIIIDLIKYTVENSIDINMTNQYKETPLHIAIEIGAYDIAMLFIQFGADVNAEDENGFTPLYKIFDSILDSYEFNIVNRSPGSFVSVIKALFAAGAKTSATIFGKTYDIAECIDELMSAIDYELNGWFPNDSLYDLKSELMSIKETIVVYS